MKKDKLVVYKDVAGEWRWKLVAPNGKVIAASSESHINKAHAVKMAERVTGRKVWAE